MSRCGKGRERVRERCFSAGGLSVSDYGTRRADGGLQAGHRAIGTNQAG